MLNIIFVSTRQETANPFVEALQSDANVDLTTEHSAVTVLEHVRQQAPQMVIIDDHLDDMPPVDLAMELLKINAMVYIAMISTMDEETFHEATEGLGLLPGIPSPPSADDADVLLARLRAMPGMA